MKRIFTRISVLAAFCLLTINVALAQNITVKGKVIDGGDKTSLPGVTILIKGTQNGTQTDENGNYSISAPANATLVFNFVGYTALEQAVNNQTTLNVSLTSSTQQLEQVVVVGYGTQRKIDVTGSVGTVKGEDISKQASVNPVSALQGKVAGVSITNNGTPGSSPQITIRGTSTIYGKTGPLYVVDGVWYDDINFLNPADIANISILKDASSQSIYGIRAANGVVLVTTVKGKKGNAVINYNGSVGLQKVTNQVEMANASEYATAVNEAYSLQSPPAAPLFANTNLGTGTNWYDQVLRTAMVNNHQLSISGGSEKSTYNFSLGYLDQDGIVKNNNYKRYTVRLANDYQIFEPLKIGYNVAGTYSKSKDAPSTIFRAMYAASPVVPVFNADGSYGDPNAFNLGNGSNMNPQATLDFFNQNTTKYKINGNVYAELKFLKNFTFKTSIGGDFGQEEVRGYVPKYKATNTQLSTNSKLDIDRIENRNWLVENTLTFDKKWSDHSLTVLAGQTAQRNKMYTINADAQNVPYTSEGDLYLALGDAASRSIIDKGELSTFSSYFVRVNYGYKNKYLLNASIRRDGASQFFGSDNVWGNFPSIGAGWVISNEEFMKNQNIFSNLKLRGSWGKVGNAGVPFNPSTQTVDQTAALIAIFGGIPYTGASIRTLVPPTLFWERSAGTDIGLEMGFLKNRLNVELDYYNRKTEQAIFDIPVLGSLGTVNSSIIANQADIQNRGFEFLATWADKTSGGLTYSISGNLGINNNKVLNVTSGANPIYKGGAGLTSGYVSTRTVNNRPIGEFYGYQVAGIFQTDAEAAAWPGFKKGDFKYADINGDGLIDLRDRVVLGNPNPKFTYGLNTNFAYKNFDLTLDIQGVADVDVFNANLSSRFGNENYTKDFFDHRWTGPGTSNTYPSADLAGGLNNAPNSFYVEKGDYIRLRNIQLGYSLPSAIVNKWKMQRLRIFLNAQNAVNIFGYKGFSPEVGGTPTNAGIDTNVYPLFATYNFGVNVTF
ncbi:MULTISPECIES: SusC/RagA family TonB-linked outer membrane protein [unclassified Pedobacter]|uniref:SusC/RagA family TonB-linked outer membrane protein n=1 Tax=unclassified Pedobacter TaxID=2628915 RepID=UPI00141FCEEF|nr:MULTISPECIES: TonB-dependent receptor [unclassified Pedobacter]NII85292.1 TonB-linked SusC/RagA family outer membrane protein [Pedobacter sp. SG908]NMN39793.1 TonB-linked SusC/RagA family outer membrane protein [Pedobacter sp. SG918]